MIHHAVVKVLAAQVRVARSRLHLEDSLLDGQQAHVESAAAQVEDEHVLLSHGRGLLVQAIGDCGCGGLVDDAHHVQPSDHARVLGRLALAVVEVGGHGDHGVLDGLAQERLCNLLHLDQHHAADLLGGELLALALEVHHDHGLLGGAALHLERPQLDVRLHGRVAELAPDQALGVEHRVDGVHRNLRRAAGEKSE